MIKNKQIINWLKWIVVAILFAILFKYSLDFFQIGDLGPDAIIDLVIMNFGIFMMIFVALGIHELGHLLVGLKNGFKFELFVVGFLGIKAKGNSIKFYLNRNWAYFGGVATTLPTKDDKDNVRKFAQILLAGPLFSFIFAIICFTVIPFFDGYFGIIIYASGMISLSIFLATTIPSRTGMFFTDRKRYQRLIKPGKARQVELAVLRISGIFTRDNSYKNIKEKDLILLIKDELPFFHFYGLFNLICYQLEMKGEIDQNVIEDYKNASKPMSKSLVASFENEIEYFRKQLK